jgi:cathepsin E
VCVTPVICLCIYVNTVSHSIGPTNLTIGSLFPDNSIIVPTVTDNLVQQGTIKENVIGIYFQPSNSTFSIDVNGELTFGGVDATKFIGDITYQ